MTVLGSNVVATCSGGGAAGLRSGSLDSLVRETRSEIERVDEAEAVRGKIGSVSCLQSDFVVLIE